MKIASFVSILRTVGRPHGLNFASTELFVRQERIDARLVETLKHHPLSVTIVHVPSKGLPRAVEQGLRRRMPVKCRGVASSGAQRE